MQSPVPFFVSSPPSNLLCIELLCFFCGWKRMRTLRITNHLSTLCMFGLKKTKYVPMHINSILFWPVTSWSGRHSSTPPLPVAPWPAGHPTVPPAVYFKHLCNTQHFTVWAVPWNSSKMFPPCWCKIAEMLTADCLSCLLPNNCLTSKLTPILGQSGRYIIHHFILELNGFQHLKLKHSSKGTDSFNWKCQPPSVIMMHFIFHTTFIVQLSPLDSLCCDSRGSTLDDL